MNIRKIKKNKLIKLPQDKETTATDKLFELSWMYEEREEDQSKVLIDQGKYIDEKTQIIRQTIIKQCSKYRTRRRKTKSTSVEKNQEIRDLDADDKVCSDIPLRTPQCIFNVIHSNRVFVGGVKSINSSRKEKKDANLRHIIAPSRRVETMPMITLRLPNQNFKNNSCQYKNSAILQFARMSFKHKKDKTSSIGNSKKLMYS